MSTASKSSEKSKEKEIGRSPVTIQDKYMNKATALHALNYDEPPKKTNSIPRRSSFTMETKINSVGSDMQDTRNGRLRRQSFSSKSRPQTSTGTSTRSHSVERKSRSLEIDVYASQRSSNSISSKKSPTPCMKLPSLLPSLTQRKKSATESILQEPGPLKAEPENYADCHLLKYLIKTGKLLTIWPPFRAEDFEWNFNGDKVEFSLSSKARNLINSNRWKEKRNRYYLDTKSYRKELKVIKQKIPDGANCKQENIQKSIDDFNDKYQQFYCGVRSSKPDVFEFIGDMNDGDRLAKAVKKFMQKINQNTGSVRSTTTKNYALAAAFSMERDIGGSFLSSPKSISNSNCSKQKDVANHQNEMDNQCRSAEHDCVQATSMDSQDQREYNEKGDSPNQSTLGQADDQQHVQMHPIEPDTVKDTQIQSDSTNAKTSDAESQTDTIKCELPLNKYELEVVQFWQKSQSQELVWLKYPVDSITDEKGNLRVQSPTLENLVKFMQEFQDVYLTAQKALHHIYIPAKENQSKPLLDLMAFLNETCKNVHCAFCVHGSNLIAVVGFEESVMEQCCKKIKEMMTGKLPDPIAVGVQTEQDQPHREYKEMHKEQVKKPVKDGQAITRKADNNHGLGHNSTEILTDRDDPLTQKEFSDIIAVDKDVFGYIKLSRSDQIKRIWKKHHVQITPLNHGEVNLQLKISSNSNSRVEKAIADFQDLYQDVQDRIIHESLDLQSCSTDEVNNALEVVQNDNVHVYQSSKGKINFIAEDREAIKKSKCLFKECVPTLQGRRQPSKPVSVATYDNYVEVYKFVTHGGITVSVGHGNIAHQSVDAIVNAANTKLQNGAGVTGAIFKQGGPEFEQECRKTMLQRKNQPLYVGEVVEVRATGKLACKSVLHLAGTQWHSYHNKTYARQDLECGLLSVLYKCQRHGFATLALPPVATGIYGTPLKVFVEAMLKALSTFEQKYPRSRCMVNYIRILSIDDHTVANLASLFANAIGHQSSTVVPAAQSVTKQGDNREETMDYENYPEDFQQTNHQFNGHAHGLNHEHQISSNNRQFQSNANPWQTEEIEKHSHHDLGTFSQGYGYDGSRHDSHLNTSISEIDKDSRSQHKSYASAVGTGIKDVVNLLDFNQTSNAGKTQEAEWEMTCDILPAFRSRQLTHRLHFIMPALKKTSAPYMKTAYIPDSPDAEDIIKKIDNLFRAKKIFQLKRDGLKYKCRLKCLAFSMNDIKEKYMENLRNEIKQLEMDSIEKEPEDKKETCAICLDDLNGGQKVKSLPCTHQFHEECVDQALQVNNLCPICKQPVGQLKGNQPDGTMRHRFDHYRHLPGYEKYGAIVIEYNFRGGVQEPEHPNPGVRYQGTSRTAYLPDNSEGREILRLLRRAFDARLTFTVGRSVTTGMDNQVTWNDIHHKTNIHGGSTGFGYPDPDYLRRVKDELKAKGIE